MEGLGFGKGVDQCPYMDKACCFRYKDFKTGHKICSVLVDTHFEDGECHFRKADPEGPNLYDLKYNYTGRKPHRYE